MTRALYNSVSDCHNFAINEALLVQTPTQNDPYDGSTRICRHDLREIIAQDDGRELIYLDYYKQALQSHEGNPCSKNHNHQRCKQSTLCLDYATRHAIIDSHKEWHANFKQVLCHSVFSYQHNAFDHSGVSSADYRTIGTARQSHCEARPSLRWRPTTRSEQPCLDANLCMKFVSLPVHITSLRVSPVLFTSVYHMTALMAKRISAIVIFRLFTFKRMFHSSESSSRFPAMFFTTAIGSSVVFDKSYQYWCGSAFKILLTTFLFAKF